MTRTVAIIGAGFCGTLCAVSLLRQREQRLHIVLIERAPRIARGVAYSTQDTCHRLNVPAARMSALPEDDNHFLRFVQTVEPGYNGGDFVPRARYGDYLDELLRTAISENTPHHEFTSLRAAVIDIEDNGATARLVLDSGDELRAERAILAVGNAGTRVPFARDADALGGRYIANPWAAGALDRVDFTRTALLIGSGLTAVDIAISLHRRGFSQLLHALSRHGLRPIAHRASHHPLDVQLPAELSAPTLRIRAALRAVRRHIAASGIDWRDAMVALRPLTSELWRKFDDGERARFLRHLQAYWEVFRHRLAPEVESEFDTLLQTRQLILHAGRVRHIDNRGNELAVQFRPRGAGDAVEMLRVGTVINCTGAAGNIECSDEPLLQALHRRGLMQADALRLGIKTASNYALIGADGAASPSLFYVGPLLKAGFWEATAVPELREHVAQLTAAVTQF